MGCEDRVSNLCVETKSSKCIKYTGLLGTGTKIDSPCVNQHMVNEDLYKITQELTQYQTIEEGPEIGGCITYPTEGGETTINLALKAHRQKVCELQARIKELEEKEDVDITRLELNFRCLVDPCGEPIKKLGQLLQILIDKSCNNIIQ